MWGPSLPTEITRVRSVSPFPYAMHHTSLHHVQLNPDDYQSKLEDSCTLYVGNLSFYTTEEQIYELFSMCGQVKIVIMGLDRMRKTPCGFCFVEYPHLSWVAMAILHTVMLHVFRTKYGRQCVSAY